MTDESGAGHRERLGKRFSIRKEFFFIFLLYAASHLLFLLSDAIVVDDWYNNLIGSEAIINHNLMCGRPWFGYAVLPIFPLEDVFFAPVVYLHRVFIFVCFFISAILFWKILERIEEVTPRARFIMTLLFAMLPYFQARIFVSMWPYTFCYLLFFLAFYLLAFRGNMAVRISSLTLFATSFMVQSFLSFFSLVFVYFGYEEKRFVKYAIASEGLWKGGLKIVGTMARKYPDYLFLPFVVWILQRTLYQPFGDYANYNVIKFSHIVKAPLEILMTFMYAPLETLAVPFYFVVKGGGASILFTAALFFIVYNVIKRYGSDMEDRGEKEPIGYFLVFAFFAFFMAVFPYAAADKEMPSLLTWANKNLLLMPVGMSFLIYYGLQRLFMRIGDPGRRNKAISFACALLLSVFVNYSVASWAEFHIMWFKQLSLVENYKNSRSVEENSLFLVVDTTTGLNAKKRNNLLWYEYIGPLRVAYPSMVKFAANANIYKELQTDGDKLNQRFTIGGFGYEKSDYYLKDFDAGQPAYYLVIKKGPMEIKGLADIIRLKLMQFSDIDSFRKEIKRFIEIEVVKVKVKKWDYGVPEPEYSFTNKIKRKVKGSALWKALKKPFEE